MDKYCPIPFFSIDINSDSTAKLCCVSTFRYDVEDTNILKYWHSEEITKVRHAMLSGNGGEKDCQVCFEREHNIGFSKRTDEIKKWPNIKKPLNFPAHLQIKVNNVCNLKCIMCSPQYSTKWNEDVDKFSSMRPTLIKSQYEGISKPYLKKLLFLFIHAKTMFPKQLELYGGEPMLAKDFWTIITDYEMKALNSIIFRATINGTILTDNHIKNLLKFKKNLINLSIDGVEDVFNFVRYPADWKIVENNIQKLIKLKTLYPNKFHLMCYFTLSSFSAIGLSAFLDFCRENSLKYFINVADYEMVSTPNNNVDRVFEAEKGYSHPAVLPKILKQKILNDIKEKIDPESYKIVNNAFGSDSVNEKIKSSFKTYCDLILTHRHVNFASLCKDLYGFIL